jgi:hypothetical protein
VVNEKVCKRCIEDAGGIELFAGDGGADDGENAGTNDCADAESGERPRPEGLFQSMLGFFRVADQLIDGFAGKQLAWQCSSPRRGLGYGAKVQVQRLQKEDEHSRRGCFP